MPEVDDMIANLETAETVETAEPVPDEYDDVRRWARNFRLMSEHQQSEAIARDALEMVAVWEVLAKLCGRVAELESRGK